MGKFIDFAEVLEKKIRQQIETEAAAPSVKPENPSGNEGLPSGFAWILGQGPVWKGTDTEISVGLSKGRAAYGVRTRPRPPHRLTPNQTLARDLFVRLGAALSPAFSRAELKKAWRRVAKATHPDHGGTSAAFREAQSAYETLLTLFDY